MKSKKLLIFFVCSMFSLSIFAQEDITPSRYNFTSQPVGPFVIDAVNAGANPPVGWQTPVTSFNNGFFLVAGGPAIFTSLTAAQPAAIQTGINIVDMGGQVGKVLCMRGKNSTYNVGTPMGSGYAGAWFNLNFYFDKNNTPTVREFLDAGFTATEAAEKAKVRVRLVFSVAENAISDVGSFFAKIYTSNNQNSVSPAAIEIFKSSEFQTTDAEGIPVPDGNGAAFYDPTKWMILEFDAVVPEINGNPNRVKIDIAGTAGEGTLLIKELKFTKNVTGNPIQRVIVKYSPATGIFNPKSNNDKLQSFVNGNEVKLLNIAQETKVSVYTANGQLMKSFTATSDNDTFTLPSGIYIINAASRVGKIVIR